MEHPGAVYLLDEETNGRQSDPWAIHASQHERDVRVLQVELQERKKTATIDCGMETTPRTRQHHMEKGQATRRARNLLRVLVFHTMHHDSTSAP